MSEETPIVVHMGTGESADTVARVLDFEATHPRHTPSKEERIRAELRLTPARYYALLARAASSLEGQAHDPITAHRVVRRAG